MTSPKELLIRFVKRFEDYRFRKEETLELGLYTKPKNGEFRMVLALGFWLLPRLEELASIL
jgi:hypothetical protein